MLSQHHQDALARPKGLTISVVVNNYNYGHFLDSCLASVAAQTRPPDQIVVVDDGSTDGSLARLEGREDLTVIAQANGGQAAAFNAGFAAATGEAILFLDADDMLRPEALEVVERLWTEDTTWLSFRMDKVDAQGRLVGHYEMAMPQEDLLPRMMKDLTFPFMPTSGNVFSRASLAWAFPLPSERWRISADALLVRAAVLSGPCLHVGQVLADYRVHGANNYHRDDTSHIAEIQRGILHIAEAGLDLVRMADAAGERLSRGNRAKILMAALRHRTRAEHQDPDPDGYRAFLGRLRVACSSSQDRRLAAYIALLTPLLPRSETLQRWIGEPRDRPERVQSLLNWIMGRDLIAVRTELPVPRAPFDGPPDVDAFRLRPPGLDSLMTAPEWHRDYEKGGYDLCGDRGRFTLRLPPGERCSLQLAVAPLGQGSRRVVVAINGEMVLSHWIHGEETIQVPFPVQPPGTHEALYVEIRVPDYYTQRKRFRRSRTLLPRLKIFGAEFHVAPVSVPDLVLPVQAERPFVDLAAGLRTADGTSSEGAEAVGSGEWFRIAPPALSSPFSLSIGFGPAQAAGDLLVMVNGTLAFSGVVGSRARIVVDMPPGSGAPTRSLDVSFAFRPEAFLEGRELWVASMGWLPGKDRGTTADLRPGERAVVGVGRGLAPYLGAGWQNIPDDGALMVGASAELAVIPDAGGEGRRLRLDLEPLDPLAAETPPVLLVTHDGAEVARAALGGRAELDVPLSSGTELEIALHAAAPDEDGVPAADHGGILLRGLALLPGPAEPSGTVSIQRAHPAQLPPLADLLQSLAEAGTSEQEEGLRTALTSEIERVSPPALWHLLAPDDLVRIAGLGKPRSAGDPEQWDGTGQNWLHAAVLGLLRGSGSAALEARLHQIPALEPERRAAVAESLIGFDPSPTMTRLEDAAHVLASAPLGSSLYALASDVVDAAMAQNMGPDTPEALASALEIRKLRDGHNTLAKTGSESGPRYFFHHIAKTGGISLRQILEQWFDVVEDYHEHWNEKVFPDPVDLDSVTPNQIVAGHYRASGSALSERYPGVLGSSDWKVIAFVREPLDWVLSDYHFAAQHRHEFDAAYVPCPLGEHLRGGHTTLQDWLDCDAETWRARLDQYWFIGTLERMDECVAWLAKTLGHPVPHTVPVENTTERGEAPSPEDVKAFRENSALEYEIYDEINARLDRLIGPRKP